MGIEGRENELRNMLRHGEPSQIEQCLNDARDAAKSRGYDVGFRAVDHYRYGDGWIYRYVVADEHSERAALIHVTFWDTSEAIARAQGRKPIEWIEEWLYKRKAGGIDRIALNRYEMIVRAHPLRAPTPVV